VEGHPNAGSFLFFAVGETEGGEKQKTQKSLCELCDFSVLSVVKIYSSILMILLILSKILCGP